MSRNQAAAYAHAFSVADFMPQQPECDPANETIESPPPTKRLRKLDLDTALAAMDLADALEKEDSTLTVSAEDNRKLLRQAFAAQAQTPNTDDEPTLDAPSPALPPGIPSPLGDDDERSPETRRAIAIPQWSTDVDLEQVDLDLHLDSIIVPAPPASESSGIRRATNNNNAPLPLLGDDVPLPADEAPARTDRISLAVSGLRRTSPTASIAPETVQAVISSRAAVRQSRAEDRRTWWIVAAIWAFAIVVGALFAFILMTTKTSTISNNNNNNSATTTPTTTNVVSASTESR